METRADAEEASSAPADLITTVPNDRGGAGKPSIADGADPIDEGNPEGAEVVASAPDLHPR
jgi:hypothetical protein